MGGSHYFWLGADADRYCLIEVGHDGRALFRHAHPNQCDCPICLEFDFGFESGFEEGLQDARARVRQALK